MVREPRAWTDGDVADVLIGMLRAIDRASRPDASAERPIALRGFSWIVNPFESGGVVIAIEMTLGAVIAGPFDVAESVLTGLIQKAIEKSKSGEVESWKSKSETEKWKSSSRVHGAAFETAHGRR
ncbi:MAG TPA: hypothetical protein VFU28_05790, partial [Vicinamibacterales bacterium]|nr:hypothetical protein [Vicinamibacterales bacterium]